MKKKRTERPWCSDFPSLGLKQWKGLWSQASDPGGILWSAIFQDRLRPPLQLCCLCPGTGGVPLVPGSPSTQISDWLVDARGRLGGPFRFSAWTRPPAVRSLLKSRHREHASCSFCFPTPAGHEFCLVKKNLEEIIAEPLHNEGMDFLKPEIEAFFLLFEGSESVIIF